jgi:hypothetical protein
MSGCAMQEPSVTGSSTDKAPEQIDKNKIIKKKGAKAMIWKDWFKLNWLCCQTR